MSLATRQHRHLALLPDHVGLSHRFRVLLRVYAGCAGDAGAGERFHNGGDVGGNGVVLTIWTREPSISDDPPDAKRCPQGSARRIGAFLRSLPFGFAP